MPDHTIALAVLAVVLFYAAGKEYFAANRRDAGLAAVMGALAGSGAAATAWLA